ncbi:MAG: hypothetical protein ABJP34_05940 [Erythrobacter sp.]
MSANSMVIGNSKETKGAWVVHHGRKLVLDANGPAEFPALDEAAKASTLLTKLGETDQAELPMAETRAIAQASGINPRHELNGLLDVLEKRRLIDRAGDEVSILGVTTRGSVSQAAEIFQEANPTKYELASIDLAEIASQAPIRRSEVKEKIGDEQKLPTADVDDFLDRAQNIGFVDSEGADDDRLLFNGNLFRRNSVHKAERVLSSLNSAEQAQVSAVAQLITNQGCIAYSEIEKHLTRPLLEKLIAAGVYDLNQVTNEAGVHVYVTSPSAFHKFVDPMVDDCFDLAKNLVAALTYGMKERSASQGRIDYISALLRKLISGREVGPATAIGEDYKVLETNRVVKLRPYSQASSRFYMKLLKKEVGELALNVVGQSSSDSLAAVQLASAPMSGYIGPEASRTSVRRTQNAMSKGATRDVLEAVRGGWAL